MNEQEPDDLEDLFELARRAAPAPSPELLARLVADARSAAPKTALAPSRAGSGWLSGVWHQLGGWPAAATLATATLSGVWIGSQSPTETLDSFGETIFLTDLSADDLTDSDLFFGFDILLDG